MSEPHLHVISTINSKLNKVKEVRALLKGLPTPIRNEPGCIRCELIECIDEPEKFIFVEVWENLDSHRAHFMTKHIQTAIESAPELLVSDFKVDRYRLVD